MKTFPMFLKMENRHVVIVGGGEEAAQKCRLMLKTEAEIRVIAETLEPELAALEEAGRISVVDVSDALFAQTALVFVATGCKGADASWASVAKDQGAVVNVVDYPDLCDAYTPSIVDRDPVVVAIGTEGTAPVLGRQIKSKIEQTLEPNLGQFAQICGTLRNSVAARVPRSKRRAFWRWVFGGAPRSVFASGSERESISILKGAIERGDWSEAKRPCSVHRIAADAARPDLISIRDARALQNADVIFFNDEKLSDVLEYARRDAGRRLVSSEQDHDLDQLVETAVDEGQNVVVVKKRVMPENVVSILERRRDAR